MVYDGGVAKRAPALEVIGRIDQHAAASATGWGADPRPPDRLVGIPERGPHHAGAFGHQDSSPDENPSSDGSTGSGMENPERVEGSGRKLPRGFLRPQGFCAQGFCAQALHHRVLQLLDR